MFLNERVYVVISEDDMATEIVKFVGICTAVSDATTLVFAGGLEYAITNNNILYTGTRYNILKTLSIPTASTLKLESDEISFDNSTYDLYGVSGRDAAALTFIFNY